jgi:hypothetical protein
LLSSIVSPQPKNTVAIAATRKAGFAETKTLKAAKATRPEAVEAIKVEPLKKAKTEKPLRKLAEKAEPAKTQTAAPKVSKDSKGLATKSLKPETPVPKPAISKEPTSPKRPRGIQALAGRLFAAKSKVNKPDEPQAAKIVTPLPVVAKKAAVQKPSAPAKAMLETAKKPSVAEVPTPVPPVVADEPKPQVAGIEGQPPIDAVTPPVAFAVQPAEPETIMVETPPAIARQPSAETSQKAKRSGSFFSRLFKSSKPARVDAKIVKRRNAGKLPLLSEEDKTGPLFADDEFVATAIERQPGLMDKLSTLDANVDADIGPADAAPEPVPEDEELSPEVAGNGDEDVLSDDTDELGPLTKSLMELQSKMKPATPQIRAFPWLRG